MSPDVAMRFGARRSGRVRPRARVSVRFFAGRKVCDNVLYHILSVVWTCQTTLAFAYK
jgi:hypothetical protein